MEDVDVGELIIDFVGEVISTEECDRRMEHEDEEATPDLYFVDIGGLGPLLLLLDLDLTPRIQEGAYSYIVPFR